MEAQQCSSTSTTTACAMPQVEIPDEKDKRFCVLSHEQVKRLNDLMSDNIAIHGRGNFPTIEVKLCKLVSVVRKKLEEDGVSVQEIRLNGSSASSVLAAEDSNIIYNDLDLIFSVDLTSGKAFERVKTAVLDTLLELLPEGVSRKRMSSCSLKEAYVSKMVKVNDSDRWSLITLGNNRSKTVELKFVNNMRRQYEFSVDSFHIMLDTLFLFYECSADTPIGENFYPTVVAESMFGDFEEALYHLHKKLIASKNPEEIRGGGLLKYCNLLCKGYQPACPEEVKTTEMYMCSRFFIDFPNVNQQRAKLEKYLCNHFQSSEDRLKYEYLMILYQVVDESTVCLMRHEHRLTLSMIEDMAFSVYNPPPYYPLPEPTEDPNLLSPASSYSGSMSSTMSTCSSMSTGSTTPCTSGLSTPQKPSTPAPLHPQIQMHYHSPPPPPIQVQAYKQIHVQTTASTIPTYEIVTSCQPSVVYSNGYYYTSFLQPATFVTTVSTAPPPPAVESAVPCVACSCNQWMIQQPQPQLQHQMQHQPPQIQNVLT